MNTIDNGIKEVIKVTPIIKPDEMYFEVKFIDLYGSVETKRFQDTKNLEEKRWTE